MKLSDGTEVRNEPDMRHMKFNGSGITEYCWLLALNGGADESYGDTDYGFANRFGKRILWGDTCGFLQLARYDTETEAKEIFAEAESSFDEWATMDW